MSALLRDVITIPEPSGAADYVLRLTESSMSRPRPTIDEYVVTDELAHAFDSALGVVATVVSANSSQGAFLTGSFGSGKSHFMAVLHALLRQTPKARAIPGCERSSPSTTPRCRSAGSCRSPSTCWGAVAGAGPLRRIPSPGHRTPPRDAAPPRSTSPTRLLEDADSAAGASETQRSSTASTAGQPRPATRPDVLSSRGSARHLGRRRLRRGPRRRTRGHTVAQLVAALVERYFAAYSAAGRVRRPRQGLAAISTHANSLGYDAVVLFLDELVLWLAFCVQDQEFFAASRRS